MTRVCNMKQNHMENADKKNALYESHITYIPRQLMFITGKTSDTIVRFYTLHDAVTYY